MENAKQWPTSYRSVPIGESKGRKREKETFTASAYNIEQYCQWKRWKSYYGELEPRIAHSV